MSLSVGSVTVNADATYSGTGLAKAIMDSEVAGWVEAFGTYFDGGGTIHPPGFFGPNPLKADIKREQYEALAAKSRELAAKLVPYLKANVVVRVDVDGDEYIGTIE